jgi:hypothetical protein
MLDTRSAKQIVARWRIVVRTGMTLLENKCPTKESLPSVEDLMLDVRYALRVLRRSPA